MFGRRIVALLIGAIVAFPFGATSASAEAGDDSSILYDAVHGEGTFVYEDGAFRSFVTDYGVITQLDADSLNIFREDQVLVTVGWDLETCVRRHGLPAEISDLHVGMRAVTIAERQRDGTLLAAAVRAGRPLVRADQLSCGLLYDAVHGDSTVSYVDGSTRAFDWDRGEITAIDTATITFERADGATVTVSYDADTKVPGPMTVADLEVGNRATFVSEDLGAESLLARVIRPVCTSAECGTPFIWAGRAPAPFPDRPFPWRFPFLRFGRR